MIDSYLRLLVVSPHFDDTVFSCGALLAATPGATVCTVFAATPPDAIVTDWDRQCGFQDAHQAMRAQQAEDDAALAVLDARPLRLNFLDSQYLRQSANSSSRSIVQALSATIRDIQPTMLHIPPGLFHSDHALAHEAAIEAWRTHPSLQCVAYEDCLYRYMDGLVQTRIAELAARDIVATPVLDPFDLEGLKRALELKCAAVSHYASQLRTFGHGGYDDVFTSARVDAEVRTGFRPCTANLMKQQHLRSD